ncbi:MAG TPA: hypothetical protein VKF63_12845 [Terracidiphilus sp.]|nr:hypothetical protein [Terracidiphilus sp.]
MAFTDLERSIEDRTIIIRRETVAKPYRPGRRRRFVAEFPRKGYTGVGLSREQALGDLLIHTPTAGYLDIVLEVS